MKNSRGVGPLQSWLASYIRNGVSELKTPTVAVVMRYSNMWMKQ